MEQENSFSAVDQDQGLDVLSAENRDIIRMWLVLGLDLEIYVPWNDHWSRLPKAAVPGWLHRLKTEVKIFSGYTDHKRRFRLANRT